MLFRSSIKNTTKLSKPVGTGGGGKLTYAISPALPGGLSFDVTNGTIGGTPNTLSENSSPLYGPIAYTVTISDQVSQSDSISFSLSVIPKPLVANTENLVESGLDSASVHLENEVNLDDVINHGVLDRLASLDGSLPVTLDVEGRDHVGEATVSDELAHDLVQAGIDFAAADDLTVVAHGGEEGTHLHTSLKELQKLGVDSVLLQDGSADGQADVSLGEGGLFVGGLRSEEHTSELQSH